MKLFPPKTFLEMIFNSPDGSTLIFTRSSYDFSKPKRLVNRIECANESGFIAMSLNEETDLLFKACKSLVLILTVEQEIKHSATNKNASVFIIIVLRLPDKRIAIIQNKFAENN